MVKPSLKSFRVDPGDDFQYRSSYHNVSRSKNRIRWKKISKFIFLTNFLKDFFKALFRSQFWAQIRFKNDFFQKFNFYVQLRQIIMVINWKALALVFWNTFHCGNLNLGSGTSKTRICNEGDTDAYQSFKDY